MENEDISYAPATPGGMEYGIEDGEIVMDESEEEGQDVEYDPLMAGNVESDDDAGPLSPDGAGLLSPDDAGPLSPDDAGPLSPDGAGLLSPDDAGPLSPDDAGSLSPDDAGPLSPDGAGLLSPDDAGPLSPDDAGSLSPDDAGPLSPDDAGPLSPDDAGPLSPDDAGPLSPDSIASPPASPVDVTPTIPVGNFEHSPLSSPVQGAASPTSSVGDGPATGEGSEHNSLTDLLDSQAEGPASPTGSVERASESFSRRESIHEKLHEGEYVSPPASPTDSVHSQGHELETQASHNGSNHSRSGSLASPGSQGRDVLPPLSPSADSPARGRSRRRSRSLSPADDAGMQPEMMTEDRSGGRALVQERSGSASPVHSRSPSGSPARSGSHASSPARSRSGSASPVHSRSPSGSPARSGSRASSPARSRSGSRSRSPNAPPAEVTSRSPSVSGSSRSASPPAVGSRGASRSRSVSPVAAVGSRSPSVQSRSRSGSPGGSRSRSVSPALSRSRSPSPAQSRSPASPTRVENVQAAAAGDEDEDDLVDHGDRKEDEGQVSDKGSAVGELIADIFGSSDEEEEFEGFGNAEVEVSTKKDKRKAVIVSDDENDAESVLPDLSDDEDVENDRQPRADFVSDFDMMLQRKKEEMKKRRRRRHDVDIINDNDDLIDDLIQRMMAAAEEDQSLNQQKKPAVKKLKMLPQVISQLKKADLHNAFLDSGVLKSITAWLVPLPDKSLPHLQIRESLLRQLLEFPTVTSEALKHSGVGKAVMYLYKHPKELRQNKEMAGKLINEWSRPIFNLTSNYKHLTREEREQRDYEQLPKKRRISLEGGATPRRDIDRELVGQEKVLRPGDPGYIYRARVPQPSHKDYVIRPKWNIEEKPKGSGKKPANKFEQHMRAYKRKSASAKGQRAVAMSIEGRNMSL